jgi:hypothetical protein
MMTNLGPVCRSTVRVALLGAALALAAAAPPESLADPLSEMISSVTVPTINEDPRMTSEIRPMFMYTSISSDFVTQGGHYDVVAMQARLALSDRFSLIATKDGYVWLRPSKVLPDRDGWANIAAGVKAALYRDAPSASILTAGVRYEAPTGNQDVLQGNGDGLMNPFLSAAKGFGNFHLQGYTGPRLAISNQDSSFYDLSLHADYRLDRFYPLFEFNWVYVLEGGRRLPIDQEGYDLVDIGSKNAGGESVATVAFGARYRVFEQLDFGAAAEFPVTGRNDIIDWRVTTDAIWRFY